VRWAGETRSGICSLCQVKRYHRKGWVLATAASTGSASAVRGGSRGQLKRGRSQMVALVREVLWATAVPSAGYGGDNGHFDKLSWLVMALYSPSYITSASCARTRPTKEPALSLAEGCIRRHRCGILGLRRCWWFSRPCPGSWWYCGDAVDPGVGRRHSTRGNPILDRVFRLP
jgi:hypothetical protein